MLCGTLLGPYLLQTPMANPMEPLVLDHPIRDLKIPLVEGQDATQKCTIYAKSIQLEKEKIGPMRLGILSRTVINELIVSITSPNPTDNDFCTTALASFLSLAPNHLPLRIKIFVLKNADNKIILEAETAIFNPERKNLELYSVKLRDSLRDTYIPLPHAWLELEGQRPVKVNWEDSSTSIIKSRQLFD